MEPTNPIKAVTHRDPYPYYAHLLAGPPLYFDAELRLWVAARACIVSRIFASKSCRVRPTVEPVPAALDGLSAGEIFSHLVRMTDGSRHAQPKLALERALAVMPTSELKARADDAARDEVPTSLDPAALTAWVFNTPIVVVSKLLGFPADECSAIVEWTRQFVACLSPLSTPEELSTAGAAAVLLRSQLSSLLKFIGPDSDNLISRVRDHASSFGWIDDTSIAANLIGLLSQTYEATAGLIGNAIAALARQPSLLGEVRVLTDGWDHLVHETSRYDSPVQNTRRFVVAPTTIGGIDLVPGEVVLLVLAAANRDPHANPDPERFRLERTDRCVFSFSRGAHACPGEALARTIAATALSRLFDAMPNDTLTRLAWTYKASTNGRLPIFRNLDIAAQS